MLGATRIVAGSYFIGLKRRASESQAHKKYIARKRKISEDIEFFIIFTHPSFFLVAYSYNLHHPVGVSSQEITPNVQVISQKFIYIFITCFQKKQGKKSCK